MEHEIRRISGKQISTLTRGVSSAGTPRISPEAVPGNRGLHPAHVRREQCVCVCVCVPDRRFAVDPLLVVTRRPS